MIIGPGDQIIGTIISDIIGKVVDDVQENGLYNTAKKGAAHLDSAIKKQGGISSWSKNFFSGAKDVVSAVSDNFFGKVKDGYQSLFDQLSGDSSSSGVGSGRGYGVGSGGRGSISGVMSGYDAYLDMLHQEQERVWQREDTAYQRTVKDMQAAGLNPVLAVNHGVSASGGSSSSDSQVVGAVADLAAMAIGGLTETARGAMQLSQMTNSTSLQKIGSWYKSNAKTIQTGVNTAAGIAKLISML